MRGRNGSGKSTLLRLLAGQLTPSRGAVRHYLEEEELGVEQLYPLVSWTGPYLEVAEELTIREFLDFHFGFKPLAAGLDVAGVLERIELAGVRNRRLLDCSSGMRQRVLLGSALYAATPLLLLDEPTVTLDEGATAWFHGELDRYAAGRLTFVASNEAGDLRGCGRTVELNEIAGRTF